MRKLMIAASAAVLASGCSDGAPQQNNAAAEAPSTLAPGQYQASWTVTQLRSVDKTTPATNLKEKATGTSTACVGADGAIDPKLFAEDGDECKIGNSYMRNGRISMDVTCTRKGAPGEIRQSITGSYTAQGLEAEASTTTYLSGPGDYAMVRTFTAKRAGECPPPVAEGAEGNSAG
jgi:hypothetical protein